MAENKLTEKQKKEYLENPNLCPFCKNEQDHITKAAEFKKPIDLVQWAQNMKAV